MSHFDDSKVMLVFFRKWVLPEKLLNYCILNQSIGLVPFSEPLSINSFSDGYFEF